LSDAVDKFGWRGLLHQLAVRYGRAAAGSSDEDAAMRQTLAAYAGEHHLDGWRTLLEQRSPRLVTHVFRGLTAPGVVATVREQRLEVLVNCGGGIFRQDLIREVPWGILNPHMGPLPKYRGMHALEWTIFHGEPPQVTVHYIAGGIDTGDILVVRPVVVRAGETIVGLRARAYPLAVETLVEALAAIREGRVQPRPQQPEEGRQYYTMHPRLLAVTERRIARLVRSTP
jgi:hypothetical protein